MKKRYTLEQKRWDSPHEHAMPEHTRVPASFTIGNVKIAPATVLAPMAGVTDTVFRRFIRNLSGCGLIMTEFTSSHGVSASLRADKSKKPNRTLQRAGFRVRSRLCRPGPINSHQTTTIWLHLAGGGAQQSSRQAGDRNGQYGCQGDDREVDQR